MLVRRQKKPASGEQAIVFLQLNYVNLHEKLSSFKH
jgi:hypothetical protein